jgi:hypothetical protein
VILLCGAATADVIEDQYQRTSYMRANLHQERFGPNGLECLSVGFW